MGFLKKFFRNVFHEGEPTAVRHSSFEHLSEEELEAHLGVQRYGEFRLTDAVRPSYDLQVIPQQGFRYDVYQDEEAKTLVNVCMTGCRAYGSAAVKNALEEEVEKHGLAETVEIRSTGCHGFCAKAPVVGLEPLGVQYQEVTPEDAAEITSQPLKKNQLIDRLAYKDPKTKTPIFQVVYEKEFILPPFLVFKVEYLLANATVYTSS